jgi:hypothetical protein
VAHLAGTPKEHKPPKPRANDGAYGGQLTKHFLIFSAGLVSLLPFMCSVSAAANITAVQSGGWGVASTWNGPMPGAGDTINIPDGLTVIVVDTRTIGASGPNGTVAITLNNSGALLVTGSGTLKVRGDVSFNGNDRLPVPTQISIQAGGTWEWDASASISPAATHYFLTASNNYRYMIMSFAGTAGAHVNVRSNPGGGNGGFGIGSTNTNVGVVATYTDFLRLGDATNHAFAIVYDGSTFTAWNVTHSTFTACGSILSQSNVGIYGPDVFVHDYNVHTQTASAGIFEHWLNIFGRTTGTREVKNNVFDVSMARDLFYPAGFVVSGNYFADATSLGGPIAWGLWTDNFLRYSDSWATAAGGGIGVLGDFNDTYVFADSDWGNPHVLIPASTVTSSLRGIIFGQAGSALGPPGPADSGELWFLTNPSAPATYGLYNSIVLPNMTGHSSLELGSVLPAYPNLKSITEHNTWFGGWNRNTAPGDPGFPALQLGEGGNGVAGSVSSFRDNILWNPQLPNYTSSFEKLADIGFSATPTLDYCAPADCDYNTGFGYTPTNVSSPQYTNQGKGYVAKFSAAPGQHDVDVDPMFVDWQRSVELFDSKYLGYRPATWNAGSTYSIGDFVQNSRADVYWSLPVNYRYVNAGACAGTNPEPGAGSHWRDCWEWASLYRIREGIRTQQLIDDQIIGAHGEDIITTLNKWIRAGYAPTNTALLGAAHDSFDIGAVPVVFLPPTTSAAGYTGPAPVTLPVVPTTIKPHGRPN